MTRLLAGRARAACPRRTGRRRATALAAGTVLLALGACGSSEPPRPDVVLDDEATGDPDPDRIATVTPAFDFDGEGSVGLEIRVSDPSPVDVLIEPRAGDGAVVHLRNARGTRRIEVSREGMARLEITSNGRPSEVLVDGHLEPGHELFVRTGPGDDTVRFGDGTLWVYTKGGDDRIESRASDNPDAYVHGGTGDDALVGPIRFAYGGRGDDRLEGTGSTARGGPGDDTIVGPAGPVDGNDGRDTFVGLAPEAIEDLEPGESIVDAPPGGGGPEPEPESDAEPDPVSEPAPSPGPSAGVVASPVVPDGLRAIWYVGSVDLLAPGGPAGREQVVLELAGDAITTDVDTVVASGERASRRQNPDRWGRITGRPGEGIAFRFDGAPEAASTEFTIRTRGADDGERLVGCFGSRRGFTAGGVASIAIDTLCLDRSGRFSNDRTVAASTPSGSGSADVRVTGDYRLGGHGISLRYDDGKTLRTTFGVYAEDGRVESLLVGERVLNR